MKKYVATTGHDLWCLVIGLIFSSVIISGCSKRLNPLPFDTSYYNFPADKFTFLVAAVYTARDASLEQPSEAVRQTMLARSKEYFYIYKNSHKYKFPIWPADETMLEYREVVIRSDLMRLKFILNSDLPIPYEDDVRNAIQELSSIPDIPTIPSHLF